MITIHLNQYDNKLEQLKKDIQEALDEGYTEASLEHEYDEYSNVINSRLDCHHPRICV